MDDLEQAVRDALLEKLAAHALYDIKETGVHYEIWCRCGLVFYSVDKPYEEWAQHMLVVLRS